MAENKKAAEIISVYRQLRNDAVDVSADLLFSTAVSLACPWHMPNATATGMATLSKLAGQRDTSGESESGDGAS